MASSPVVSVLMPCLNPGRFLDEAISSCLAQPELKQLIVADGGSDQETQQRLEAWANRDARVLWWSKGDQGPADALNHALARAEAEFIGWLNADDRFEPGSLARAVDAFQQCPSWQMVYGHGQHIDADSRFLELYPSRTPEAGLEGFQDGCYICQPTVLLRRDFLMRLGGWDACWRTCFDLDLWLRAFVAAPEDIGFVSSLQASTRLHPDTITAQQQWLVNLESAALLLRACGHADEHWIDGAVSDWPQGLEPAQLACPPVLRCQLEQALDQRQPLEDCPLTREGLPSDLQLLLTSRLDLQACGFDSAHRQRAFTQWLLLHGLREYPALAAGEAGSNPVLAWLADDSSIPGVSRIALAIWDSTARHRRRWSFPHQAMNYRRWLKRNWHLLPQQPLPRYAALFGMSRGRRLLLHLLRRPKRALVASPTLSEGVTLVGYASDPRGIGEDLRTTAAALEDVGVNVDVVDFPIPGSKSGVFHARGFSAASTVSYSTTLLCLTAEESIRYVLRNGRSLLQGRYVIGYWPWELPFWPTAWHGAFELVDEIWVSSRHIQSALLDTTLKPVRLMPLCVDHQKLLLKPLAVESRTQQRQKFNLPTAPILVICSFDLKSTLARKNPWGAIQAFQRAFSRLGDHSVALVIKTFALSEIHSEWEPLKQLASQDSRVHILEDTMSRSELSSLYGCCDVLLSLHRAEGFGRVLAEALQLGLDVIATDWSGNLDFCNGPLSHPVPYELVPVPPGAYPHWQGQHWADPDVSAAASLLQRVVERRTAEGLPPTSWALSYRERFSAQTCGRHYRERLQELGLLSAPACSRVLAPT